MALLCHRIAGLDQSFPRFLQEGFALSSAGSAGTFVWVYRKDAAPFRTNVINVGVEGGFYTDGRDSEADDLITKGEAALAELVSELRMMRPGKTQHPRIPALFAHLELRTRHWRESVLRVGNFASTHLLKLIGENGAFMDRLQERLLANSPELRDAISDAMVEHGIPLEYLDRVVQMAGPMLPGLMPNILAQLVELAKGLAPNLEKVLREAAKKGHITTLKKEIAPQTWVDRYQHLHYSIVLLEHAEMILGDSAVLFRVGAARTYKTTIDKDDAIEAALLPISNEKWAHAVGRFFGILKWVALRVKPPVVAAAN